MTSLFIALGIAVLTLLALLLWFVPHLLQQQAHRSASESAQLREMLLDMLNEQEAVTTRQSQLGASISYLQDQLEQMIMSSKARSGQIINVVPDQVALRQIEERISTLQNQIQGWTDGRTGQLRKRNDQENVSWGHLLSLLAAIQDRVGQLSTERPTMQVGIQAGTLLSELEEEMQHLRTISEDIATLQWRLRRSLHEREQGLSGLRIRAH